MVWTRSKAQICSGAARWHRQCTGVCVGMCVSVFVHAAYGTVGAQLHM